MGTVREPPEHFGPQRRPWRPRRVATAATKTHRLMAPARGLLVPGGLGNSPSTSTSARAGRNGAQVSWRRFAVSKALAHRADPRPSAGPRAGLEAAWRMAWRCAPQLRLKPQQLGTIDARPWARHGGSMGPKFFWDPWTCIRRIRSSNQGTNCWYWQCCGNRTPFESCREAPLPWPCLVILGTLETGVKKRGGFWYTFSSLKLQKKRPPDYQKL